MLQWILKITLFLLLCASPIGAGEGDRPRWDSSPSRQLAGDYRLDWENLDTKVKRGPPLTPGVPPTYRIPGAETFQPQPAPMPPAEVPLEPGSIQADSELPIVRPEAEARQRILESHKEHQPLHPSQERVPRQERFTVDVEAHRYYDAYSQEYIGVERVVTWTNRRGHYQRRTWWNQGKWNRFAFQLTDLAPGDYYEARVVWDDGRARTVYQDIGSRYRRLLVIDEPDPFDRDFFRP